MGDWPDIFDEAVQDAPPASSQDDGRLHRLRIAGIVADKRAAERRKTYRRIAAAVFIIMTVQAVRTALGDGPGRVVPAIGGLAIATTAALAAFWLRDPAAAGHAGDEPPSAENGDSRLWADRLEQMQAPPEHFP